MQTPHETQTGGQADTRLSEEVCDNVRDKDILSFTGHGNSCITGRVSTKVYNFTQHKLVEQQIREGVRELPAEARERVCRLMTFDTLPDADEVRERAVALAGVAAELGAEGVMAGGATFLMAPLVEAMKAKGIRVFFAFSRRETTERINAAGAVEKLAVFRHAGLVEM